MLLKKYPHNPPHLFIDGAFYFITGGIIEKHHLIKDQAGKYFLQEAMQKWFPQFRWQLDAWIILSNHYHLMVKANLSKDMPTIVNRIHGASATFLNRKDGTPGRKVWWNYWDTCIRGDIDFEFRMSYIYWNAVKHGVVEHPKDYKWSSFTQNAHRRNFGEKPPDNLKLKDNFDDF